MHVSVEFVIFKQKSSHLSVIEEDSNGLIRRISDFDGCSLKLYLPGRRWTMVYSPTHIMWKEIKFQELSCPYSVGVEYCGDLSRDYF